jgi:hypothetical protein
MRTIQPISEHEMVATFLKAETNSDRYSHRISQALKKHNADRKVVDHPDLSNEFENTLRMTVLDEYRDYQKRIGLFDNFPSDVQWRRVVFTPDDLHQIKYIDYDYWVVLSGGSRLAADAAKNILKGIKVFDKLDTEWGLKGAQLLKQGHKFPEMIFVSTHEGGEVLVLEGHARLTCYLLIPDCIPHELPGIIGYSPNMVKWVLF